MAEKKKKFIKDTLASTQEEKTSDDEEILKIAGRLMEEYADVFEKLAG